MLSSLPKLADRAFILGAFLPTLLFALATLFLFNDLEPIREWIEGLAAKDLGQAAYLLLAVWAIAVIILMLNTPLYRFLEGYTFPNWLAEPLKARNRKRLQRGLNEIEKLWAQWTKLGSEFPKADLNRYQKLKYELTKWMPSEGSLILPTRFGNAIRAFETYPGDIYGADGIVIWLRLASVIPKAFADQVQDMRSQVDFLINCSFFSAIIALFGLLRTVYSGSWHDIDLSMAQLHAFVSSMEAFWLLWAFAGFIAAYLFYLWAVTRVPAWGELVMSAFDCYLPALAGQLGFELPATELEQRSFWISLSRQLIYRREPNGQLPFHFETWKRAALKPDKEQERAAVEGRPAEAGGPESEQSNGPDEA